MRLLISGSDGRICCAAALAVGLVVGLGSPARGQCFDANGKISRNFYRIPYGDGKPTEMGNDYVNHSGAMDMGGQDPPHTIVAAADGVIEDLEDSHNECGNHGDFCCCVNWIGVRHANNEISRYYHIRQNSATALGLAPGVVVVQGQVLGIEGDVGITGGKPGTSPPRTGPCVPQLPPDYPSGWGCQDHLHWGVLRAATGELMVPMTCNIAGNNYVRYTIYTPGPCDSAPAGCNDNATLSGVTFAAIDIVQANNTITANTVTVESVGSVVLHAGGKVRLLPGFEARAGSYFRAEIGDCNTTAASGIAGFSDPTTCQPVSCGGCP